MGTAVTRQDDLGRKVNCQATTAGGGIEGGGCYGFSGHEQQHLAAFSNGYNDLAGGDGGAGRIGPPPLGIYPGPGGGGRHQNSPTDNSTHKKDESEDVTAAHKVLKMSPNASGDSYDEHNKSFAQGRGSADNAEAKNEDDFTETGNRDRSGSMDGGDCTFAAVKAERNEEAATKAGHSSPGDDNCETTRSDDQKINRKPGEQGNIALDGVQRAGSNNGGMIDIPEWPAIPDLKFNDDGNGECAHTGGVRQRLQQQEEQSQHSEMASGAFDPLTPASSSSSTLPSEMSRQEQEIPQHITGEYHKLRKEPEMFTEKQTSGQYYEPAETSK